MSVADEPSGSLTVTLKTAVFGRVVVIVNKSPSKFAVATPDII